MNTKITVSMAAAAVVAISMAFMPASADQREESAAVAATGAVAASAETPQEAVWDMTYGAEKPVLDLLQEVSRRGRFRHVFVQKGNVRLELNRA